MGRGSGQSREGDAVLDALDELLEALQENSVRIEQAVRRIETIRKRRQRGDPYREIVEGADEPLLIHLTRENLMRLFQAGSRLRTEEARALHAEGMTMEEIARTFGVTRQRISALLRQSRRRNGGGRAQPGPSGGE